MRQIIEKTFMTFKLLTDCYWNLKLEWVSVLAYSDTSVDDYTAVFDSTVVINLSRSIC